MGSGSSTLPLKGGHETFIASWRTAQGKRNCCSHRRNLCTWRTSPRTGGFSSSITTLDRRNHASLCCLSTESVSAHHFQPLNSGKTRDGSLRTGAGWLIVPWKKATRRSSFEVSRWLAATPAANGKSLIGAEISLSGGGTGKNCFSWTAPL